MKLGIVTYDIARDWDLPTIISKCEALGMQGVELRVEHAHGVTCHMNAAERAAVRARFAASPVELVGIGSICEYHATDPAELRRNIEETKEWVKLAADLGAPGVKVRPNYLPEGRPEEETIAQIGSALAEVGEFAQGHGVEIRLEVHGERTCDIPVMHRIMEAANHPNVFICWNCNWDEPESGSIARPFAMLAPWVRLVHMRDLTDAKYPWRQLFALLRGINYDGFCLAEIDASSDPDRVLTYYRTLFDCLNG